MIFSTFIIAFIVIPLTRSYATESVSYARSQLESGINCIDNPNGIVTDICGESSEKYNNEFSFYGEKNHDPEEDAILSEEQEMLLNERKDRDDDLQKRVVIKAGDSDIFDLWPEKKKIPYEIHTSIGTEGRKAINDAIKDIEQFTCVRFKKREGKKDKYFLKFFKGSGCWSFIGMRRDKANVGQKISIGDGCESKGEVLHQILHAFGFLNEHTREDRDIYVQINWENIIPGKKKQFQVRKQFMQNFLASNYDYSSIMHYGRKQFSKNGKDTIWIFGCSKKAQKILNVIGQRKGLSGGDKFQINMLFKCPKATQRESIIDDSIDDSELKLAKIDPYNFNCNVQ